MIFLFSIIIYFKPFSFKFSESITTISSSKLEFISGTRVTKEGLGYFEEETSHVELQLKGGFSLGVDITDGGIDPYFKWEHKGATIDTWGVIEVGGTIPIDPRRGAATAVNAEAHVNIIELFRSYLP